MQQLGFGGRSLTLRVLALLSLALLPLGSITVWQTYENAEEAETRAELALLLLTERATNDLQTVILRGNGAARGLGQAILETVPGSRACDDVLARFQDRYSIYSRITYSDPEGQILCASDGQRGTLSDRALAWDRGDEGPASAVRILEAQTPGVDPSVVLSEPVIDPDEGFQGSLSLFAGAKTLLPPIETLPVDTPITLVTFNAEGEILTGTRSTEALTAALPGETALAELADGPARVFVAADAAGDTRTYGLVPLLPNVAYALSSWPDRALQQSGFQRLLETSLLPILMWLSSLFVAFVALDRLILRHIRGLSRQMRTFARTRRMVSRPILSRAGADLARIEIDFREMAHSILQDEAQLENNLHEKNILLKEVHHRVKNNLQLITSIMNMQMRKTASTETRQTLRRLQERVLTLASVHRTLYRSSDMNRIDAGVLVRELVEQLLSMSPRDDIRLEIETDEIKLFPDQAVPLSMLCSEAMTNAVRFAGPAPDGVTAIRIELRRDRTAEEGCLTILSTLAPDSEPGLNAGLGAQLIRAFESQLSGTLTMGQEGDMFRVRIIFPIQTVLNDTRDY